MTNEKHVSEMMEGKGRLHLQTVNADVNLEDMYGEERKKREKALVRKIDLRMMPLMMLLCESPRLAMYQGGHQWETR